MPDDPPLSLVGDDAPLGDPNENLFEETTVERLKELGYDHYLGNDLRGEDFPETQVVHRPTLRAFLKAQYPQLDETAPVRPSSTSPARMGSTSSSATSTSTSWSRRALSWPSWRLRATSNRRS
ncbi:MAG: hypothetical protein GVY35_16330 [Bacteroidetes bacterium]|jgi:hypothetical protein|nr:hypothetical protein [Bacteroidota bacterium]